MALTICLGFFGLFFFLVEKMVCIWSIGLLLHNRWYNIVLLAYRRCVIEVTSFVLVQFLKLIR